MRQYERKREMLHMCKADRYGSDLIIRLYPPPACTPPLLSSTPPVISFPLSSSPCRLMCGKDYGALWNTSSCIMNWRGDIYRARALQLNPICRDVNVMWCGGRESKVFAGFRYIRSHYNALIERPSFFTSSFNMDADLFESWYRSRRQIGAVIVHQTECTKLVH